MMQLRPLQVTVAQAITDQLLTLRLQLDTAAAQAELKHHEQAEAGCESAEGLHVNGTSVLHKPFEALRTHVLGCAPCSANPHFCHTMRTSGVLLDGFHWVRAIRMEWSIPKCRRLLCLELSHRFNAACLIPDSMSFCRSACMSTVWRSSK